MGKAMIVSAGKILVTGAGGFIGSHLTEALVGRGYRVKAFLRYNSAGRWGWLEEAPCSGDIEFVPGDIRDFDAVYRALEGCTAVFHLAALIGIPYSAISPQAYVRTNVEGCHNVLEASRLRGLEKVLMTSSSEVYGTAQRVPIDEAHPLHCQSPYAATKAAGDHLALSYQRCFGLPVTIVRPFNTYGPRQSARAIIPATIIQVLAKQGRVQLGNLHPSRDFTFVRDVVEGYLAIAGNGGFTGEVVHIGSGREIRIGDLAQLVGRLAGKSVSIVAEPARCRPASSEVERLLCDNSKLLFRTSWTPTTGLEDGLGKTIEWIASHLDAFRAGEYTI